jgi:hypothetical protein
MIIVGKGLEGKMRLKLGWKLAAMLAMLAVTPAKSATLENTGSGRAPDSAASEVLTTKELEDIELLRDKAERGRLTRSMLEYASVLEYGIGPISVDLKGAYDLYEKAADRGEVIAIRRMCVAYLLGQGRPLNPQKAYSDYCDKLPNTDATFLFSSAYDYEMGLSAPKNEATALSLYVQAFQKGSIEATYALGRIMLASGKLESAIAFLRGAVFNGSVDAMDQLARLLETGQGIEADADEAWWLYVNAARRGNAHAQQRLSELPQRQPLLQGSLKEDTEGLITQTLTDKDGSHTSKFSVTTAANDVLNYIPNETVSGYVDGVVEVHCHVDKHNVIDVCMMLREIPAGYGYGPIMMAKFRGKLSIAEKDHKGRPTAGMVYAQNIHWVLVNH